ncbi:hypothetical protein TIFTF001_022776 [Ficus carica]|uniref:Uncharacterized protein n=1 Tax=Ficus carica TaxID=3494 RepID=A0AA88AW87_FICCA|nr:hypothetical protein TIFTF001_022776 [Ficus carica]
MAVLTFLNFSSSQYSLSFTSPNHHHHHEYSFPQTLSTFSLKTSPFLSLTTSNTTFPPVITGTSTFRPPFAAAGGGGGGDGGGDNNGNGGGDDGGEYRDRNKAEALMAVAEAGRSLESLPKDLAEAVKAGRLPGAIVKRYFELEKSTVFRWLLGFGGFKERLLADDLFLTKVAIECGVGIFTKTAAEFERRRENFKKELDFVFADVVMALIADFMLVWLPAPAVSLRPPLAVSAGTIAKFFHGCPENAFQIALAGTSYSLLQRIGAILRNGAKLFAVGTSASLIGTGVTNALITARKVINKSFAGEAEDVPILSTSVAYGVYMSVSSNLRYQILAGIIEQRILEPLLHQHKVGGLYTLDWNSENTRLEHSDKVERLIVLHHVLEVNSPF